MSHRQGKGLLLRAGLFYFSTFMSIFLFMGICASLVISIMLGGLANIVFSGFALFLLLSFLYVFVDISITSYQDLNERQVKSYPTLQNYLSAHKKSPLSMRQHALLSNLSQTHIYTTSHSKT